MGDTTTLSFVRESEGRFRMGESPQTWAKEKGPNTVAQRGWPCINLIHASSEGTDRFRPIFNLQAHDTEHHRSQRRHVGSSRGEGAGLEARMGPGSEMGVGQGGRDRIGGVVGETGGEVNPWAGTVEARPRKEATMGE